MNSNNIAKRLSRFLQNNENKFGFNYNQIINNCEKNYDKKIDKVSAPELIKYLKKIFSLEIDKDTKLSEKPLIKILNQLTINLALLLFFPIIYILDFIFIPILKLMLKLSKLANSDHKVIYYLLNLSKFFYSDKNTKEIFEPIIADWQEEYFEALFKKETWKARWINVRYTYAFLTAMWQKSPIGDLIEFVVKIAKG